MNSIRSLSIRMILLATNLTICGRVAALSQSVYTVTDLGTLGGTGSTATGTNNSAQVVGQARTPGDVASHAFLWQNGTMTDLLTLGGTGSIANGINNSAQVVGNAHTTGDVAIHAFVWQNGLMTDLGTLGGTVSSGVEINNSAQVVGFAYRTGDVAFHAFLWQNGTMTDLLTLGGTGSIANGINNSAQVVGIALTPGDVANHAFLWQNGAMADLNSLVDSSSGWILTSAESINDNGEIAGWGVHNGLTRAFLLTPTFRITSPQAGELWIAGEQDTIRWSAPPGLQLRIEFSDDDGGTYSTVATNIQSDSNHYVWDIPPALSRKCRIKLVDIANTSMNAVSERFKVKGYQLTRLRTDSSYEAFRPDLHGWRFLNTADTMWPGSWWGQFNYQSGLDPYTNELYPDDNPFASAFSDDFVDWPLFVKSFLPSRCYLSLTPPVYSPSAAFQWGETTIPYSGSCDGFAISSLLAFDFEQAFLDSFPTIGTYVNLYDLPVNDERRKVINQLWEYQFGVEHLSYVLPRQNGARPRETLQELKNMLIEDYGDHRYLRAIDQGVPRVHALVPHKLERDTVFPGFCNVYVYDCNRPGDTSVYVVIDSTADSWEYPASGYSGNKGLFLMEPVSAFLPHPTLGTSPVAANDPGDSLVRVFTTSEASIVITNSRGETIGFGDSTVTSTFAEGIPIFPPTSRYQPPIGYYIPLERYAVQLSDFTDSVVHLSILSDSVVYSYRRHDALSSQTDRLGFESTGFGLRNPDGQPKVSELRSIIRESNAEKVMEVTDYAVNQNDSGYYGVTNHDHLRLVNTGNQKLYTLKLLHATGSGQTRFLHSGVDIPANSSQEIAPTWTDLGMPVTIYVDLGNNGTIDDTVFVGNTLDVDERGLPEIPKEYSLAQNYPNPFNPSTTISYQIPSASRVVLRIYNILGQEVATLLDEERPAGSHVVRWNGQNSSGRAVSSGVYFYRVEVKPVGMLSPFTSVKKMLLLR